MKDILFELAVIIALLIGNGLFAMAEISVVSARRTRLRTMAEAGDKRARLALELSESPNRFLATVQIGITLVGIFAGAFGGATMAGKLSAILGHVSWLAPYAYPVSFTIVVALITYLSLVIGELVPKQIGLSNPERIARLVAGPMNLVSRVASPVVSFLSVSSDLLIRLLNVRPNSSQTVSEEDVKVLVREGLSAGVFEKSESEMVESVLSLDRLRVRDVMTPRPKIIWVHVDDSPDVVWHKVVASGHTRFPVYDTNRDNVIGSLSVKALYANLAAGLPVKLRDLTTPALFVPEVQPVPRLLETFKKTGRHLALVTDEFGSVTGLVTVHDVLESIIGDFTSIEQRLKPTATRRDDGSWLVDAMIPVDDFEHLLPEFKLEPAGQRSYETFGGFVVKQLGVIPKEGDFFEHSGYRVEVIDMDNLRIDKVALVPLRR